MKKYTIKYIELNNETNEIERIKYEKWKGNLTRNVIVKFIKCYYKDFFNPGHTLQVTVWHKGHLVVGLCTYKKGVAVVWEDKSYGYNNRIYYIH